MIHNTEIMNRLDELDNLFCDWLDDYEYEPLFREWLEEFRDSVRDDLLSTNYKTASRSR